MTIKARHKKYADGRFLLSSETGQLYEFVSDDNRTAHILIGQVTKTGVTAQVVIQAKNPGFRRLLYTFDDVSEGYLYIHNCLKEAEEIIDTGLAQFCMLNDQNMESAFVLDHTRQIISEINIGAALILGLPYGIIKK